jgi:hypothetical protein
MFVVREVSSFSREWSDPSTANVEHCGAPATIDIGYPTCDEHGAEQLAKNINWYVTQTHELHRRAEFARQPNG